MAAGRSSLRQLQGRLALGDDHRLEAHLVGLVQQDGGEPGLVLDDQDDAVAGPDLVAGVAADLGLGHERGTGSRAGSDRDPARRGGARSGVAVRRRRGRLRDGHVVERAGRG